MNINKMTYEALDRRVILSATWVFVLLNMIYADVLSFLRAEFLQELLTGYAGEVEITDNFLLLAAVLLEIPIAMVLLSRVLPYKANRWANIIAGIFTIVFVIGGGSFLPHYIFIVSVEVAALLFIIWYAWTWPQPQQQVQFASQP